MSKVAVIVVTYNRKEMLQKNLKSLVDQTAKMDKIFVIDNCSNDGTEEMMRAYTRDEKIEYKRLTDNIGGAGGFYTGIKMAKDRGYDYIWGMDDDAFPEKNALEEIIKCQKKYGRQNCYVSNSDDDKDFKKDGVKLVRSWMFVGFFMPTKIIDKVGLPRKDFFIYHDDMEYANRIIKAGIKIFKVEKSVILHKDAPSNMRSKRILGKKISFPILPNWKMYYYVRNGILMYKWSSIEKYKALFITSTKNFVKVLAFNKTQLPIFFKGYIHGLFGISGRKELP